MSKPTFDIDAAPQALRDGQDLSGKGGILAPLIKQFTEAAMLLPLRILHLGVELPNDGGVSRETVRGCMAWGG